VIKSSLFSCSFQFLSQLKDLQQICAQLSVEERKKIYNGLVNVYSIGNALDEMKKGTDLIENSYKMSYHNGGQ
jgi:hypothetical protein